MGRQAKFLILALLAAQIIIFQGCKEAKMKVQNRNRLFDAEWKFLRDNITGAEQPTYDDSNWRTLDLPHDWSIEDLPGGTNSEQIGPFSKNSAGGFATGHTVGGIGWYRKQFSLDPADAGSSVSIQFDGIFNESDVWLNGKHVGFHPNGYTSFVYDLSAFLNPAGQPNLLAVRVKNIGKTCR
ncbi:MAG TPA: sugar-binding domain-containing protein, partial [Bacteroidales bacterium]